MSESRPRAYRGMMQDLEFPGSWTPFSFERRFTAAEYERLAAGFPPGDMDDKWFIYLEDDTLYFHRSWTGRCIFKLRLLEREGEYVATDALGADYPAPPERHGRFQAIARLAFWRRRPALVPLDDATILNEVIDVILLGKPVPWLPRSPQHSS